MEYKENIFAQPWPWPLAVWCRILPLPILAAAAYWYIEYTPIILRDWFILLGVMAVVACLIVVDGASTLTRRDYITIYTAVYGVLAFIGIVVVCKDLSVSWKQLDPKAASPFMTTVGVVSTLAIVGVYLPRFLGINPYSEKYLR